MTVSDDKLHHGREMVKPVRVREGNLAAGHLTNGMKPPMKKPYRRGGFC
jgi:hypothetical protein